MFQELLRYSSTSIGQRGLCSFQFNTTSRSSQINLAFWSGNVYNCLCLSEFPNSLQPATKILEVISSFLAVTSDPPTVCSLLGFERRVNKTLTTELDQPTPVCIIPTFNFEEIHKMLAGPCVKILDRYDFQSVLQFLSMKLRTALGSSWLDNLHELRRVRICPTSFISIFSSATNYVFMQLSENGILLHNLGLVLVVFFYFHHTVNLHMDFIYDVFLCKPHTRQFPAVSHLRLHKCFFYVVFS